MGKYWNAFSQNVLKTYGWNLLCIIKEATPFGYKQAFVSPDYLPLALGYIDVKIHVVFKSLLWNKLTIFHQIFYCAFCRMAIVNLFKRFCTIDQDDHHANVW